MTMQLEILMMVTQALRLLVVPHRLAMILPTIDRQREAATQRSRKWKNPSDIAHKHSCETVPKCQTVRRVRSLNVHHYINTPNHSIIKIVEQE